MDNKLLLYSILDFYFFLKIFLRTSEFLNIEVMVNSCTNT